MFLIVFHFSTTDLADESTNISTIFSNLFYIVTLIIAIGSWWIVLSHENRERAEKELLESLEYLEITKNELVQSEKLASLGKLVAGIAHEVNTPLGICVTVASSIPDSQNKLQKLIDEEELTKSDLDNFFEELCEATKLLNSNLAKAASLIRNFKQIAVDQTTSLKRKFNLKNILQDVITALKTQIKNTRHEIELYCDELIELESYPGPLGQVVSNLIENSIKHGFTSIKHGIITINVKLMYNNIIITVQDNGVGIPDENINQIFDPFFTTKMGEGGTGLGLHIVYNIITSILGGKVHAESDKNGCRFIVDIPLKAPNKSENNSYENQSIAK